LASDTNTFAHRGRLRPTLRSAEGCGLRDGHRRGLYLGQGHTTGPLFLRVQAPDGGLSVQSVKEVVRRACRRAGIPSVGPHRLRHVVASRTLAAGASLTEVGQVLRHSHQSTTAIYAKVDRARLRELAQPWPGESA
jgi:integrase/recombinase XerD